MMDRSTVFLVIFWAVVWGPETPARYNEWRWRRAVRRNAKEDLSTVNCVEDIYEWKDDK